MNNIKVSEVQEENRRIGSQYLMEYGYKSLKMIYTSLGPTLKICWTISGGNWKETLD